MNEIKVGSLLAYVKMVIGGIVLFVYTPILIQTLGKSEYGVYNTVVSTVSMLSVLNLGFGSGYVRYLVKYQGESERISKLNGLFLLIFSGMGVVALVSGLFMASEIEVFFEYGLKKNEIELAQILMVLLTINLAVSFPASVFSSIIAANEKFVVLKILEIMKTVITPAVTIPFLLGGYGAIAVVIVTAIVSVLIDIIHIYFVLFVLKNRFIFRDFEKGVLRSVFSYTVLIGVNTIVNQINTNLDNVLLGRYKGAESVTIYSVAFSIYNYYVVCSTSVSNFFVTRVHKLICETEGALIRRRKVLTELFIKVGRIQFIILALVSTGFVFFGSKFVQYWAGEGYDESFFVALLLMLSVSVALIQNIGIEMQRAQNLHWFRSLSYGCMAVLNLLLSIFLCPRYGAIGCAAGTAISYVLANGLVMNIFYHKKCCIDILKFWKAIMKMSLGLVIPIIFGICMTIFIEKVSLLQYAVLIALYSLVYLVSMWNIAMNSYEKEIVRKIIKKIRVK